MNRKGCVHIAADVLRSIDPTMSILNRSIRGNIPATDSWIIRILLLPVIIKGHAGLRKKMIMMQNVLFPH